VFDDYITNVLLIISGFGSGVFVGMGSGATGAIMITFLTVFINHSVHDAIGTSLMIDGIIGGIAGIIFLRHDKVALKPCLLLIITGATGSFLGSRFTSRAPESSLLILIGIILILLGFNFITKGLKKNIDYIGSKIHVRFFKKNKIAFFIIFGLIAGFGSGFSGMGIGGVIALVLILVMDYEIHMAIGTSLFMMFFISGSGAIGHIFSNEVLFESVLVAGSAAIIGSVLGSFYANKIDEERLGRLIGLIILIMGTVIIFRVFF
jgi:uncharacterized membrane protein YfcA